MKLREFSVSQYCPVSYDDQNFFNWRYSNIWESLMTTYVSIEETISGHKSQVTKVTQSTR